MRVRGRTKLVLGAVLARRRLCIDGIRGNRHRCEHSCLQPDSEGRHGQPHDRRIYAVGRKRRQRVCGRGRRGGRRCLRRATSSTAACRRAAPTAGAATTTGKKAKSNPAFNFGFEGLNHYQQRYSRGGNQFSVEPPDQGMCAGNGYVVETVNDVFNVFSQATGASLLPDNTATNIVAGFPRNVNHAVDLNSFYGYPPAINRTTGVRGEFVTDPSCIYDAATQRFFVVVAHARSASARSVPGCVQLREPPRPRCQPDVESDGRLEHLPDRRHGRWFARQHRWRTVPVPRRLSAHRCGRERHLPDDERLSVGHRATSTGRRSTRCRRRSSPRVPRM